MKKIIILSDTHGNNDVMSRILKSNNYDIAIHSGDYECDPNYMIKNFDYFVQGNHDFHNQPNKLTFEIEGIKFHLQHGHLIGSYDDLDDNNYMSDIISALEIDVIIHGHTHKTKVVELDNNKYIVNPGSTILPRGTSEASYLLATIDNGKINFEIKLVKEIL
jgi:hypothetical protein